MTKIRLREFFAYLMLFAFLWNPTYQLVGAIVTKITAAQISTTGVTANKVLTADGSGGASFETPTSGFSGNMDDATNKVLSNNAATNGGVVEVRDTEGTVLSKTDGTNPVTHTAIAGNIENVNGNMNITGNVSDTSTTASDTVFTDKISSKTPNSALTITNNTTVGNDVGANSIYTDKILAKTPNGALTITARITNSGAFTTNAIIYTDKINSKTPNTPLAMSVNVSGTNASLTGNYYADNYNSATTNATITFKSSGTAGIDMSKRMLNVANLNGGNDTNGSIPVRWNGAYQGMPVGIAGQTINATTNHPFVKWQDPPMSMVSGGYVDRNSTNLRYLPAVSNRVYCYELGVWVEKTIPDAGLTVACTGLSNSTTYTAFVYDANGDGITDNLELVSGNPTVTQNGLMVKGGATSRTALALCYTNSTGAIVTYNEDAKFQGICNYYNKRPVALAAYDTTDSWLLNSTWRSLNSSAANRVEFVTDGTVCIIGEAKASFISTIAANGTCIIDFGLNSTSTPYSNCRDGGKTPVTTVGYVYTVSSAMCSTIKGFGYNYIQMIEYGAAGSSAVSVYGDNGGVAPITQTGMIIRGDF